MGFDSVVFADTAALAALSCFARLKSERASGRTTLIVALAGSRGAEVISRRGLAEVTTLEAANSDKAAASIAEPLRERLSVTVRRFDPRHVLAPLGLLGAPQAIDYFGLLRSVMNVDKGRDLLFFEERPHCLVPEAITLRLASLGVRLPPAVDLRSPRRRLPFVLRLHTGLTPPLFGSQAERFRLSRSLRSTFREAADWDPQRALGPKLQPVTGTFSGDDAAEVLDLAGELDLRNEMGSANAFNRRMLRHAALTGSRTPIERSWLSLPNPELTDAMGEPY